MTLPLLHNMGHLISHMQQHNKEIPTTTQPRKNTLFSLEHIRIEYAAIKLKAISKYFTHLCGEKEHLGYTGLGRGHSLRRRR